MPLLNQHARLVQTNAEKGPTGAGWRSGTRNCISGCRSMVSSTVDAFVAVDGGFARRRHPFHPPTPSTYRPRVIFFIAVIIGAIVIRCKQSASQLNDFSKRNPSAGTSNSSGICDDDSSFHLWPFWLVRWASSVRLPNSAAAVENRRGFCPGKC